MKNTINQWIENHTAAFMVIVLGIAALNLFLNLGSLPILNWDEARHGLTAAEMLRNNDFIRTTYLSQTDYWNLKPPLGSILTALSYKIFGFSAFAMRFPSALAAFLSVIFSMLLAFRRTGKTAALTAGLVLTSAFAFIEVHSGRSGDFDAGLVLLYVLTAYFLDKTVEKPYNLVFCGLTVALAFLLKSFAFMPLALIVVCYFFLMRLYRQPRSLYWMAGGLLAFLVPVGFWILARYHVDGTEFFSRMVSYDLLKRSSEAIEGHSASILFYLEPYFLKFFPWSLFFVLALVYRLRFRLYRNSRSELRLKAGLNRFWADPLMISWFISLSLFLAAVKTRCEWYLDPLYPLFAIAIGWLIRELDLQKPSGSFWQFIQKIAFPALVVSFVIAECAILYVNVDRFARLALNEKADMTALKGVVAKQQSLRAIPAASPNNRYPVYAAEWTPADLFIARVEKNRDTQSLPMTNFAGNGYYLLDLTSYGKSQPASNRLELIQSNAFWVIVKK